jgi:hypothetical protein
VIGLTLTVNAGPPGRRRLPARRQTDSTSTREASNGSSVHGAIELMHRSRARPWIGRVARRWIRGADKPWTRPLIGKLLERLIREIHGETVTARYAAEDDCWVIEWPQASVPLPELWHGPSPSQEEEEARDVFFQEYTPVEGDVVVDVGAGIGTELGLFSRLVGPTGRVYAIEVRSRHNINEILTIRIATT